MEESKTESDGTDSATEFAYVVVSSAVPNFDYDTRHEAIGVVAVHGNWHADAVVPVVTGCLVRWGDAGPRHLGDQYYDDRDYLATTHGAVRIECEEVVRKTNGEATEVVESRWFADCPICGREHDTDEATEDARSDLFEAVLDCCGAEWVPPSDWVWDCPVCGRDHRGEFGCPPVAHHGNCKVPVNVDDPVQCLACGWDGAGGDLSGVGRCPGCQSGAVEVSG